MDAMIGTVIANIGRDGLHQLYEVTGNARGLELAAPLPKRAAVTQSGAAARGSLPVDRAARRAAAVKDANDSRLPRAIRFERLGELAFSSCGTVREVLFGAGDDVRGAFDRAVVSLARFPSERAYIDLLFAAPDRGHSLIEYRGRVGLLIGGAANVAATALQQPRIATCTHLSMELK